MRGTRSGDERNPLAKKVAASYARFQALTGDRAKVSEGGYYSLLP